MTLQAPSGCPNFQKSSRKGGEISREKVAKNVDENCPKIDAKNADAYCGRGMAKINIGQKDKACADLSRAVKLGNEQAKEQVKKYCN